MPTRPPRDARYRALFPNADAVSFSAKTGGFIPLPISLRKLMRYLTLSEFRVLVYLHLRASRYGICFPTPDEMIHEMGLSSKRHLTEHIEKLEGKRLISRAQHAGRTIYLVHDPRVGIEHLANQGDIKAQELDEINGLLEDLNLPTVELAPKRVDRHTRAIDLSDL